MESQKGPLTVYEVTLSVDKDVEDTFVEWLRHHIDDMLKLENIFLSAEGFKIEENVAAPTTKVEFVVQYRCAHRGCLEEYLAKYAAHMRSDALKRFEGKFSASRRIYQLTYAKKN